MRSAVKALKKVFPGIELKTFEGYGHGEILQHPELQRDEIDRFVKIVQELSEKTEEKINESVSEKF
ncbi:MAG: hypothetical protein JW704_01900 [Anaerolineaceae bacterium]|nr:hypothetical protein [Anaerolineaceae bacterium]